MRASKMYKAYDILDKIPEYTSGLSSNPDEYGIYSSVLKNEKPTVNVSIFSSEKEWEVQYKNLLSLLEDGIESKEVEDGFVHIIFSDNYELDLSLMDYLLNLIMWSMLIRTNVAICSYHVFFDKEITKDTIKDYIDRFLIDVSRKRFTNMELNNIIDDTLCRFHDIDQFSMFFSNTVNLEDNVFLMNTNKDFYECMHADLSGVPMEDIKSVGMNYANKAIDIMKDSKTYLGYDHCLADACRASEGINPKQFKEFTINIGTKPDGRGGIFDHPIPTSFINGGVSNPLDYFIESSTGRIAQIIKFNNVGSSGHFARLLGLNNMDSWLHEDPNYDCCSTNFLEVVVKDKKILKMLNNRYYRLYPDGMEMIIKPKDTHLIGKKIYLRSPITCASAARGQGYCYKCYGDLAYTVYDAGIHFGVNIGRIASECLSSGLTQKLLSAKHLLETFVEKITWTKEFYDFFEVEGNLIKIESDVDNIDIKDFRLVIDTESIEYDNEEDDDISFSDEDSGGSSIYNQYICEFDVLKNSTGELIHISNDKNVKLYISNELNSIIKKNGEPVDGKIYIDFSELKDAVLFIMLIQNNELSKTLEHLENLLNKNSTISGLNIHQLLQSLLDTINEGGIKIASTHIELIVSNQIRDPENKLKKPKWYEHNPPYEIYSLNRALTENPSITVSMSFQKVGKLLYNPLSFKKTASSFMDLFFMERPQYAIYGIDRDESKIIEKTGDLIDPMVIHEDPNKITAAYYSSDDDDDDQNIDD